MIEFLAGAVTLGFAAAAAFFFSFWRKTADRLFLAFGVAFLLFALNQLLSHVLTVVNEPTSLVYILRILGFVIIIVAIVDKNVQKPLARTQRRAR
jgi:Family of unknown function (DUF5985)